MSRQMVDSGYDAANGTRRGALCQSIGTQVSVIVIGGALITAAYWAHIGFAEADACAHAMDGVVFRDMLVDQGFWDPIEYGKQFYARYPCLGTPYYYPPGFGLTEAPFYVVFGVSITAARLCVLCMHIGGLLLLFTIVSRTHQRWTGFLAACLMATAPLAIDSSRTVMLEAPTVSMMLLATWLLLRYEDRPSATRAVLWAVALAGSVMFKQTALFIIPAHATYLLVKQGFHVLRRREVWLAAILVGVVVVPYAILTATEVTYLVNSHLISGSFLSRLSPDHLFHWPCMLPEALGWPLAVLACLGIVRACFGTGGWPRVGVYASWIGFFYVQTICLGEVYVLRYVYLWVPPFAVFGADALVTLGSLVRYRCVEVFLYALLFAVILSSVAGRKPSYKIGFEEAARYVAGLDGGSSVLIDAHWDGDFVFFSRQHDPKRRIILRGSKVLYTFASMKSVEYVHLADSKEQILDLLRRYGTRYIVVDMPDREGTDEGKILRELLQTGRFRHLRRIPIEKLDRPEVTMFLDVYEFPEAQRATAGELELFFPGLGNKSITVKLDQ